MIVRQGSKHGDQLEAMEVAWTGRDHEGLDQSGASQALGLQNPLGVPTPLFLILERTRGFLHF